MYGDLPDKAPTPTKRAEARLKKIPQCGFAVTDNALR
jgi:hypothetical protein